MNNSVEAVFIGGSAGSLNVILEILPALSENIDFPIVIIFHRKFSPNSKLSQILSSKTLLKVVDLEEKMKLEKYTIYVAPADYHVLIEADKSFSLDFSEKMNYSRPSIDVTFQSASEVFSNKLLGILLSGSNNDGALGVKYISEKGGQVWIQNPDSTNFKYMPQQAIKLLKQPILVNPQSIADKLNALNKY
ncbi:chemotaxis protein CheB [Pedobacter flavus]|uniref:protein-glutamate methylesterase n=1 Tax=Pedobacter flavus TaxID=3113906 RepID=A0ABU7GZZ1_9SPHI|nr:chemotaxis protein CheB [Pedobacter sp. VNH31]MEE1884500.1 chemotaxis protein CheB [Pedobacter sp. VNH31]